MTRRDDGLPSWPTVILMGLLGVLGMALPWLGGIIGWLSPEPDTEV